MIRAERLPVLKTCKLFIDGKFPRTESGRTLTATPPAGGHPPAHYCRASKKDLRDAVSAARRALPAWSATTAYLRGQILYRLAEMLESRAASLTDELCTTAGAKPASARTEVSQSIDRLVSLAGWPDKLSQVFGSVNPVAGPYFNFSTLEPTGVIFLLAPDTPALLAVVSLIGTALVAGNGCVLLTGERFPTVALSLAEAIATSDVPAGVVNILTGLRSELAPVAAGHREIDAILDASGDAGIASTLQAGSAVNLKRVHTWPAALDWTDHDAAAGPWRLLETTEIKTTWHPVGV